MTLANETRSPLQNADRFFIGGEWVQPSSNSMIDVIDSATEELFFQIAEAQAADMDRAVAAREAGVRRGPVAADDPRRARRIPARASQGAAGRGDVLADIWPRESGVLATVAGPASVGASMAFDYYAGLADTFPFEEPADPSSGGGSACWSASRSASSARSSRGTRRSRWPSTRSPRRCSPAAPSILKASPEAPGAAYVLAEVAEAAGLPPGVLNVVTADREVSELLVRDPRVDKIAFTGSTAAGRRIASICGERIARYTLELGGKSAAVILDDADLEPAAMTIAGAECFLSGQVCSSLTRLVVSRSRHDEFVEALAGMFSQVKVGDPFDPETQMGPLAMERQRDRVEGYIAKGVDEGATLVTGGGRPKHLDRGYYIEPTVFAQRRQLLDHRPRGDLRPGAERHPGRRRGAGRPDRQRHHLRPQRLGVHRRRRPRPPGRRPAALRHRRAQQLPDRLRHRLRRLQAVGHRPRGRQRRACSPTSRPRP